MKDINILISNGVNIKSSLEYLGDFETYVDTLKDFMREIDGKVLSLKNYIAANDINNYTILVHSLKSDSRYLGFEKLSDICLSHEMAGKESNFNYIRENFATLVNEVNSITNIVKTFLGDDNAIKNQNSCDNINILNDTILVVDDSNIVRNFVSDIFKDRYDVVIANDGLKALDIIKSNDNNKIMGMLLDLNMPNVDGFQVLKYFNDNDLFSKIPVAIITGECTKENIEKAYLYPIVDMLQKPFNEENVKNIVNKLIMIKELDNDKKKFSI